ncbi:hypothetical protein AB0F88_16750 [Streptosporangium sp. NPDC023963]|uniref:hypothetical protein n=1 Tax=Streptosporangium sp. NPDC023963 TaxID=3155608 RepID=UPI003430726B
MGLTVKANAPVLGMYDGQQYDVADSPFIRKVIASGKLTLLADPSSPGEETGSSDGGPGPTAEEPLTVRGRARKP